MFIDENTSVSTYFHNMTREHKRTIQIKKYWLLMIGKFDDLIKFLTINI